MAVILFGDNFDMALSPAALVYPAAARLAVAGTVGTAEGGVGVALFNPTLLKPRESVIRPDGAVVLAQIFHGTIVADWYNVWHE